MQLYEKIKNDGGFSLDTQGEPGPASGYYVSRPAYETRLPLELANEETLRVLFQRYANWIVNANLERYAYVGAWNDNGTIYLDVSERFASLSEAKKAGRKWEQLGIYDAAEGETIYL